MTSFKVRSIAIHREALSLSPPESESYRFQLLQASPSGYLSSNPYQGLTINSGDKSAHSKVRFATELRHTNLSEDVSIDRRTVLW